ncbi:MAG: sugar phosphate isomerase/epimerase [Clostridia bacterium]|nr:sugar phosphate isomerase/epimerase [Clostridia bacterium]
MIEIGISSASFFLKAQTEDTFDIFRSMGCEICEIFLNTFSEYEDSFTEMLAARRGDVRVHSVHSLNNHYEPELFNQSDRTRGDAEAILRKVLRGGERLGAKYYTFHGQARLKSKPYNVNSQKLGERCKAINAICNEYGINLSYENVHWALYNYSTFFREMQEYAPDISATLDIKQAMQSGISCYDYLEDMGTSLSTVHACDYHENGKLCIPGEGCFDFVGLFEKLLNNGYDKPVLLELYSGDYKDFDDVKRGYEYLKDCLAIASR